MSAVLLNSLLLLLFGWWLSRERRRAGGQWLLPALGWRLLLTGLSARWPSPDLAGPAGWGKPLAGLFWERPAAFRAMLAGASLHAGGRTLTFYQWSGTLFWYKAWALLSIVAGGQVWLVGLYLSLLCFVGCWSLVRVVRELFPETAPAAGAVAFLAWPTVVWWSAGFTKETLLLGAGAGTGALLLPLLYGPGGESLRRQVGRVVLAGVLGWVMGRVRYFFALPLLGGWVALAGVQLATRRGWLGPGRWRPAGALLLGLGLVAAGAGLLGGERLRATYFVREVDANYRHGLQTSAGRPHLVYRDWEATPAGLLRHAPLAVGHVLVRPWPGESARVQYVGAGLENVVLAGLVGLAGVAVPTRRRGRLPGALALLLGLYCVLLAAFIGLTTPNLGSLARYRSVVLPWALLGLLQNGYAQGLLPLLRRRPGGGEKNH